MGYINLGGEYEEQHQKGEEVRFLSDGCLSSQRN